VSDASKLPASPSRRRTRRVALSAPVKVSGKDVEKSSFTLTTTATNLNRNGAMLQLNRDLPVDSIVVITNGRGARTSARVVAQTSTGDIYAYGMEFLEADNVKDFWASFSPLLREVAASPSRNGTGFSAFLCPLLHIGCPVRRVTSKFMGLPR